MDLEIEQTEKIVVYTFIASNNAAVDAWADALQAHLDTADPPFFVVVDVSAKNVEFTPYARQTTARLFPQYRQRDGYMAFIFSGKTAPFYARIFFAGLGRLQFTIRFFNSRDAGVAWLQNQV